MSSSTHLDYIDYIKGLAAISVILLHTLPDVVIKGSFAIFHIWQAVPVFLFISIYLGFRNLENNGVFFKGYYSYNRFKRIFIKLWVPLLILAVPEAIYFFITGNNEKAVGCLLCYNNGPGSYYIWCYMQIWLLMPVIYLLLKRLGIFVGGGILLVVSVLFDFLWERFVGIMPGFTCFRYLFLSVPAYMYLKGANLKKITPLFLFSIFYLALMLYSKAPVVADSLLPDGWEAQTSLGFFYTLFLFVILVKVYGKLKESKIKQYITHLGTISWELFIVQMILLGSGILDFARSKIFNSIYLQISFKVLSALVITLLFAELYKQLLNIFYVKNKKN